jgi:hypothetical protein
MQRIDMTIYAIRRDGYSYQELDLEVDDFIEIIPENIDYNRIHDFSVENLALAPYWKPMNTGFAEIEGEKNLIPDVSNWIGATLFLSPKAHRLLRDLLAPFGEFLPVFIGSETFFIFNCLTVVQANQSNEVLSVGEASIQEKVVFKTLSQQCIDIYCTERLKSAIESFDLKGVVFDKNLRSY